PGARPGAGGSAPRPSRARAGRRRRRRTGGGPPGRTRTRGREPLCGHPRASEFTFREFTVNSLADGGRGTAWATVSTPQQTSSAQAVLAQIRSALPSLRPSDAKVAQVLLAAPGDVVSQTVAEVAAAAGVSEATVIHCCKELGFSGFQYLKFALARDHAPASSLLHEQQ